MITELRTKQDRRIRYESYKNDEFSQKRILLLLLCNIMVLTVMMPLIAYAQESDQKNVRVGWYESPFNYTDQNGRRSGYAYEYQNTA